MIPLWEFTVREDATDAEKMAAYSVAYLRYIADGIESGIIIPSEVGEQKDFAEITSDYGVPIQRKPNGDFTATVRFTDPRRDERFDLRR